MFFSYTKSVEKTITGNSNSYGKAEALETVMTRRESGNESGAGIAVPIKLPVLFRCQFADLP